MDFNSFGKIVTIDIIITTDMMKVFKNIKIYQNRRVMYDDCPKGGTVAEIGVYLGDNAIDILDVAKPKSLHLIDPWEKSNYSYNDIFMNSDFEHIYNVATTKFHNHPDFESIKIHRMLSYEASQEFPDNYFDWIYIDGNHSYDNVSRDLHYYYQKVKLGGLILGHDFTWAEEHQDGGQWGFGVIRAVLEFTSNKLTELIGLTDEKWSSYMMRKINRN